MTGRPLTRARRKAEERQRAAVAASIRGEVIPPHSNLLPHPLDYMHRTVRPGLPDDQPKRPGTRVQKFVPEVWQRKLVMHMSAIAVPHEVIARRLKIDALTLVKHFDEELKFGKQELVQSVQMIVAEKALQGDNYCMDRVLRAYGGPEWKGGGAATFRANDGSTLFTVVFETAEPQPASEESPLLPES